MERRVYILLNFHQIDLHVVMNGIESKAQTRMRRVRERRRYLEAAADHAVDGVVATASDAHHLYPRRLHRRERAPSGRAAGPPVVPPPASWRGAQVSPARKADEGGSRGGSTARGHGHSLPSLVAKCWHGEVRGGRVKRGMGSELV